MNWGQKVWIAFMVAMITIVFINTVFAFGPIPKADQCISVNALINRSCAPVYMCNGTKDTNADWCCSTEQRWLTEERRLIRWYKKNCRADG